VLGNGAGMAWVKNMTLRVRLVGILAVGILILVFSKKVEWGPVWVVVGHVVHDLGIAFVVAAVLGLTVDFSLKTEVAKDVFKATLGYILRPEFRDEK